MTRKQKTFRGLRRLTKRFRRRFLSLLLFSVSAVTVRFPYPVAVRLCEVLSLCAYRLLRKRRRRILTHLKIAFGQEKSEIEIRDIARASFLNLGRSVAELFFLNAPEKMFPYLTIEVEGSEHITEAFQPGKGLVFATAHFGNWELMAAHMSRLGHRVNVVARSMHDDTIDEWLNRTRRRGGAFVIKRGKADLELFRCLKRNEGLGILYDLDTRGSGMFIDFFGQPAYTQTGPVALSLRTGAPILVGLIHRESRYSHRISIKPPIFPGEETGDEAVRATLTTLNNILENEVKEYPTEWAWSHRRWRRKPERRDRANGSESIVNG